MAKKRVLVAMSGGVDSSAAAALLLDQGYEVEGATMQIWQDLPDEEKQREVGCCSLSAVDDARRVAMKLGIRYHVFNFKDIFKREVIHPFIQEYLQGHTPNPCIMCNKVVKFEAFLARAMVLDFDYIATGHYARIAAEPTGRWQLLKSRFGDKDQTYALYTLTQEQLCRLLLPVGDMEKPAIRGYAVEKGLPVAHKPDSQDICFVDDGNYGSFIESQGYSLAPGDFVDREGHVIGRHQGIARYTVGQRKGLGQAFGKPMYVVQIDAQKNRVVLGENQDLMTTSIYVKNPHFIPFDTLKGEMRVTAKIRYNAKEDSATIRPEDGGIRLLFDRPQRAATPGQAAVFYDGERVVGGGTIVAAD